MEITIKYLHVKTMNNIEKYRFLVFGLIVVLLIFIPIVNAQEVESNHQTRTSIELGYKLSDQLKLNLSPEFRFDENLALDKYLFEGAAIYKPSKIFALGATYRFVVNLRDEKDTEYFNRVALSATMKKEFNRFEPAFRLRYSNYADDAITDKEFIRYKGSFKYDIDNCKITPSAGIEVFQQLSDFELYKTRYSVGTDYKLFKKNYLGVSYKFDSFAIEDKNTRILSLTYKLKL